MMLLILLQFHFNKHTSTENKITLLTFEQKHYLHLATVSFFVLLISLADVPPIMQLVFLSCQKSLCCTIFIRAYVVKDECGLRWHEAVMIGFISWVLKQTCEQSWSLPLQIDNYRSDFSLSQKNLCDPCNIPQWLISYPFCLMCYKTSRSVCLRSFNASATVWSLSLFQFDWALVSKYMLPQ